jgi:hypothetical protein
MPVAGQARQKMAEAKRINRGKRLLSVGIFYFVLKSQVAGPKVRHDGRPLRWDDRHAQRDSDDRSASAELGRCTTRRKMEDCVPRPSEAVVPARRAVVLSEPEALRAGGLCI